jgi:hypothetical protein
MPSSSLIQTTRVTRPSGRTRFSIPKHPAFPSYSTTGLSKTRYDWRFAWRFLRFVNPLGTSPQNGWPRCKTLSRRLQKDALDGKRIVIVGCGAQGLNQGLNLRDSGLEVSFALRKVAISDRRLSFRSATENGFEVGTFDEMIPRADLVANLTPDKQHSRVIRAVTPLLKPGATLFYAHGFNIVEEGMRIRDDITVVMVAPKSPPGSSSRSRA